MLVKLQSNANGPVLKAVFSNGRLDTLDRSQVISRQASILAGKLTILSVMCGLVRVNIIIDYIQHPILCNYFPWQPTPCA